MYNHWQFEHPINIRIFNEYGSLIEAEDGIVYLQSRATFSIEVSNNHHERVAVRLLVDGQNPLGPNRAAMYVLVPDESILVKGWRTGDTSVRRFVATDNPIASMAVQQGTPDQAGQISVTAWLERPPRKCIQCAASLEGTPKGQNTLRGFGPFAGVGVGEETAATQLTKTKFRPGKLVFFRTLQIVVS